jgi:hypothetical protein
MVKKPDINWFEGIVYFFILLLLGAVTCMYYFFPDLLWKTVQEDALFENLTVVFLFGCLGIVLYRIIQLSKQKAYKGVYTFLILFFAIFFVIGEEISWGQRLLHLQPGEFFIRYNTQSEITFHNLQIGKIRINKLIFTHLMFVLIVLYFLFSRFLCRKVPFLEKIRSSFCIPLPKARHALLFVFSMIMVYAFEYKRNNEVMELIYPLIFLLIFLFPYKSPQKESLP